MMLSLRDISSVSLWKLDQFGPSIASGWQMANNERLVLEIFPRNYCSGSAALPFSCISTDRKVFLRLDFGYRTHLFMFI